MVHVVVFVFGQSSAKDHVLLLFAQGFVFGSQLVVALVVHRVEGLCTSCPFAAVLATDNGEGLLTELKERITLVNKKEAFLYQFNPESYAELKEKGFRLEF